MKALFLSHENLLTPGGGGNQICSREYRDVLVAAGFNLQFITHRTDRGLANRLMRKLAPSRYPKLIPEEFWKRVQKVASEVRPEFVFCNFGNFIPVATRLRQMMPKGVKLVLLSHGLASVDDLHRDRVAATSSFGKVHLKRLGPGLLGSALLTERKGLPIFDHVFCLAEFEVPINRWLGAHSVSWWPRTRPADQPVDWQPTGEFVGLLGTLDHPPNLEGIHLFCRALADRAGNGPKVRIVTRSSKVGEELAQAYAFVDHLGSLEDQAVLRSEVSRWNAFVHPIFCHAMGCSTKVAIGLGWGLPVLTSAAGVRGYRAGENVLRVAQTPNDMARMACDLMNMESAQLLRRESLAMLEAAPTVDQVAEDFRRVLLA